MFTFRFLNALVIFVCLTQALIPITIKGKRFIKPNADGSVAGETFFIKGLDYQPGGSSGYDSSSGEDALSDTEKCYRDAYIFQQLGINTLRIYTLNPDVNHDECVSILNDAGIYLLLDVNSGDDGESLNRADPASTYNSYYLTRVFKFIEAFKNYPNVLGFISGNEVINDEKNYAEITPNYIRAVQRDMKQYIANHANRTIPVGYAAADNIELRRATYEYLQCNIEGDEDDESRSDFFGLNTYEWCSGTSDWSTSGYQTINDTMSNTTIPLLFSEFGCNTNSPRTFDEVSEGLFKGLVNTFSGGLVYEYTEEAANYGVVEVDSSGSVTLLEDFVNLKDQYANVSTPTESETDVDEPDIITCDADIVTNIYEAFGANFTLPDQPSDITDLIENGVDATNVGELVDVAAKASNYTIYDTSSKEISDATVTFDKSNEVNSQTGVTSTSSKAGSSATASSSSIKVTSHAASPSSSSTASSSASSSSKGNAADIGSKHSVLGGIFTLFSLITYLI